MTDDEYNLLRLAVARGVEGVKEAFDLAMAPLDRLRESPRWIPIGERVPEEAQPVMLCVGSSVLFGHRRGDNWYWHNGADGALPCNPTHWREKPEGPR